MIKKWIEQLKQKLAKKRSGSNDEPLEGETVNEQLPDLNAVDDEIPSPDKDPTFSEKLNQAVANLKKKISNLTTKKNISSEQDPNNINLDEEDEQVDVAQQVEDFDDEPTESIPKLGFAVRLKQALNPENLKQKLQALFDKTKSLKASKAKSGAISVGNQFKDKAQSIDWMKLPETIFSEGFRGNIHRAFLISSAVALSYGVGKTLSLMSKDDENYNPRVATARPPLTMNELTVADFNRIGRTNVFRTDTVKKDLKGDGKKKIDRNTKCIAATKKTKLPLTLINTVVLQDEVKSIASVQVRSSRDPESFRVGETIGKYAKIDKISRLEVVLKNLKDGSCELLSSKELEQKEKSPIQVLNPRSSKAFKANKTVKGISNDGNNFKISRKFLQGKMKDISSILTQARAIRMTNPDGSMAFKITEIVPDSVFSNLGIQDNDIISTINGKKITDMNQVMSLFGKINTVDNLSMDVQRDGRKVPLEYSFTE